LTEKREPGDETTLTVTVQLRGSLARGVREMMEREGNPATTILRRLVSQGIRAELGARQP
jgi:hypothetical protein